VTFNICFNMDGDYTFDIYVKLLYMYNEYILIIIIIYFFQVFD
jgi:hypothetical protein